MEKSLYSRNQKVFLDLLRRVREEAELRQEDVAARLAKPQSFISKYESGERRLDVLELREVCFALGLPITDFVKRLEGMLSRRR
jgi:transcriptional regulator with XRE-family HTH domain